MPRIHGYRYVEHTADVEFIAYGKTLNSLFKDALLALFDTAADLRKIAKSKKPRTTILISDRAHTIEDLLWYVLQDALSAADSKGIFLYHVKNVRILEDKNSEFGAKLKLIGVKEEPELARLSVKGVSKYNLKVGKKGNFYKASVVLDV